MSFISCDLVQVRNTVRWRPDSEWSLGAWQFYKIPWSAQVLSIIQLGRPTARLIAQHFNKDMANAGRQVG